MSTVADFNRIDDCDKIDSQCIDAFSDLTLDEDGTLCSITSWGQTCVDIAQAVKDHESCTTMYLSPETDPNCLVYESEEKCGDNICIHGDDLSRIISMRYLKDVSQTTPPSDGIVYMYNGTTKLFEPYDLKTTISNINTAIQNINATLANHGNRISNLESRMNSVENRLTAVEGRVSIIEEKITPPEGAPSGARIVHGTINIYGDYGAAIDGSGNVTSLDKTHGLYSHSLNTNAVDDQIMG